MNSHLVDVAKEGVASVLRLLNGNLAQVSETSSRFSARIPLEIKTFETVCRTFGPVFDLFELLFILKVQQGEGNLKLTRDKLSILNWEEDPDLSPPQLEQKFENVYRDLAINLKGSSIEVDVLGLALNELSLSASSIEIELSISINKNNLLNKLEIPSTVHPVFYVYSRKFIDEVSRANISEFSKLVMPQKKGFLLILLCDVDGIASGSNIEILGLDSWTNGLNKLNIEESSLKKVDNALTFRADEVNWEGFESHLTPYHLNIHINNLNRKDIANVLAERLNMITVAYLANQVILKKGGFECHFKGYKKTIVFALPNAHQSELVYKLFYWIFDNSSSDKLDIVRHIITLRAPGGGNENYIDILNGAGDVLGSAKDNFQTFIKQSVEFYFDTRSKISDYLQKFNEDIGLKISSLASELIENLYKTVGVILGVAITIVLDPNYTALIIFAISLLYFAYILFVFIVLLGTTYLRFSTNIKEYGESFSRFGDIFSEAEISKLKGNTFQRARRGFLITFAVVSVIYGFLGAIAVCLADVVFKIL